MSWIGAALSLSACDVQVRDTTAAEYPADHDLGMYEVSAVVSRDALVTPGCVYVVASADSQKVVLTPNARKVTPPQPRQVRLVTCSRFVWLRKGSGHMAHSSSIPMIPRTHTGRRGWSSRPHD